MNTNELTRRGQSRLIAPTANDITRPSNGDSDHDLERLENEYWIALLRKRGATVKQAAEHYLANVHPFTQSPKVKDACKTYLSAVQSELSPAYLYGVTTTLRFFAEQFGAHRVCDVGREAIRAFVKASHDGKPISPSTCGTRLGRLAAFFKWAEGHGYCAGNPCRDIQRPRLRRPEPEYYTAEECGKLLEHARKRCLVRCFAVQLFGGARPSEAACLTPPDIQLAEGRVIVRGKMGRRSIPISETLRAWLQASEAEPYHTNEVQLRHLLAKTFKDAGVNRRYDCLRHTAASVCAALHGSTAASELLGHTDLSTARRHYIGLMTRAEAVKIEALRPTTPANVIQFRAA